MARPSIYSQELGDKICEEIVLGRSLRSICDDEEMPSIASVFKWLREKEEFSNQYARAKEEQADTLADEILNITDDGRNDWMERLDDEGRGRGWSLNGEHVQRSKLRIDTRKWIASKLKPKKYGDKVDVEHSGSVGVTFTTVYEGKPEDKD